jgi:flagellar protein FlaI
MARDEKKRSKKEDEDDEGAARRDSARTPQVGRIPQQSDAPANLVPPRTRAAEAKAENAPEADAEAEEAPQPDAADNQAPMSIEVREDATKDDDQAALQPSAETKAILRKLKHQQKLRMKQDLAEAEDLEQKAKELGRRIKEKRKVQSAVSRHSDQVRQLAPQLGLDPSRPITRIPELTDDNLKQVEFTTVQEGRSFIRVVYDADQNRYMYQVIEPTPTATERDILEFIKDTLIRTLEGRKAGEDEEGWEQYLEEAVQRVIIDHSILIDDVSQQRILYYIMRDFLGYATIDVMMRDPMIEDISCDGPGIPLYIFHRQYESIPSNVTFEKETALDSFVIRLAQRSGKHISIAEPLLDATLPDTSRLQATLSREVTTRGSSFTIRKFRADPLTPPDLVRLGTISSEMAAYFWLAMEEGSSLLFAGGTASGKTTLLNAISQFIPPDKKVVSIEDTREINLGHENWIAGLTRTGFGGETVNGKPAGAIDMYKLLEAALRQRPEYLLVGEVRGAEALTLFQAMATGHATYSTLHADSIMSAVYRLENKPISIPRIMLQTLDAVAVQVQVRINDRMVRRLKDVTEITGIDPDNGDLLTNAVFHWDAGTDAHNFLGNSHVFEMTREKKNLTRDEIEKEWRNRTMIIDWMVEKGIRHIRDVSRVVSEYYRKPETLMTKVRDAMKNVSDPEQEIASAA